MPDSTQQPALLYLLTPAGSSWKPLQGSPVGLREVYLLWLSKQHGLWDSLTKQAANGRLKPNLTGPWNLRACLVLSISGPFLHTHFLTQPQGTLSSALNQKITEGSVSIAVGKIIPATGQCCVMLLNQGS